MIQKVQYYGVIMAGMLILAWGATLWNHHAVWDITSNFKVEMPALSLLCLRLMSPPLTLLWSVVVLSVAFATALTRRWAWYVGVFLLAAILVVNVAALLPVMALANGLNGGDATAQPIPPGAIYIQPLIVMGWNLIALATFALGLGYHRPVKVR